MLFHLERLKLTSIQKIKLQGTKAVREKLAADAEVYDPRKFLTPMRDAIKLTVIGKMREFGSSQKA